MEVGNGLKSSTKHVKDSKTFRVDNKPIVVVDCPGFNDTSTSDVEILEKLAKFLIRAHKLERKIVGFLYFHNITDTRVGGTALLNMQLFTALCGESALSSAVYVTNMWPNPPTADDLYREAELKDHVFKASIDKGARMARHDNTRNSAHNIIRMLLGRDRVITRLQRQLVDENVPLIETDAGKLIEDLKSKLLKKQKEMDEWKVEREQAPRPSDRITFHDIETNPRRMERQEWHRQMDDESSRQIEQIKGAGHDEQDLCKPIGVFWSALQGLSYVVSEALERISSPNRSSMNSLQAPYQADAPSFTENMHVTRDEVIDNHQHTRQSSVSQSHSQNTISTRNRNPSSQKPPNKDEARHSGKRAVSLSSPPRPKSKGVGRQRRDTDHGTLSARPTNLDPVYSQHPRSKSLPPSSRKPLLSTQTLDIQYAERCQPLNIRAARPNQPVNCDPARPQKTHEGGYSTRAYSLPSASHNVHSTYPKEDARRRRETIGVLPHQ
ncbi:hypothetical protein RSOLAG22IIIB_02849 [Rhizoctonia solani]|uniref:G domain-containing protein n=1 Tax=Rhizoctonia solani TaxID=456999 RepID=A0A0K6FLE6_9AGAM|nr:hypothetical protein RSOLAG22IIIB_02849 [Rhizoctonia solani]